MCFASFWPKSTDAVAMATEIELNEQALDVGSKTSILTSGVLGTMVPGTTPFIDGVLNIELLTFSLKIG